MTKLGRRVADEVSAPPRRVLVALQDPVSAGRLAKRFSRDRVIPTLAFSCDQLVQQVRDEAYGLIVVDAEFACDHASGCLDRVRAESDAPVVAVGDIDEDVHPAVDLALDRERGAQELAAKGTALIEMGRPVPLPHPIRWGGLELNMRTHQAKWRGRALPLTTIQFRIMEVLVLAAGAVVTSEQLSRRVWGDSTFDDRDRLVAHIRRIRKLIERDTATPEFLLRVRGRGFRLAETDEASLDIASAERHDLPLE